MAQGLKRELLAEFLGTLVLMVFGLAVVAQVVLSGRTAGDYLSINIGWGLAVMFGCYVAAGVSGAHLNPAVTIALAIHRGFPWPKAGSYIAVQVAAAFTASAIVYLTYFEAFDAFDGGVRSVVGETATAGIFSTYPQPFLSTFPGGFLDQVVGTALLMGLVFAVIDRQNVAPVPTLAPVVIGMIVLAIGMTFGYNAGYAINPARDFGPRLFTALFGWGRDVFTTANHWWWVPIVGPVTGAILGGWVYDLFVTRHHPERP
jgi:MIP family channel proteins